MRKSGGDSAQRIVVAEGHVPDLAGEDGRGRRPAPARCCCGEITPTSANSKTGRKAGTGRLWRISRARQDETPGAFVVECPRGDKEGEQKREEIRDPSAGEREKGVARERPEREVDAALRLCGWVHSCATPAAPRTTAATPTRMSTSSHQPPRRSLVGLTRVIAMQDSTVPRGRRQAVNVAETKSSRFELRDACRALSSIFLVDAVAWPQALLHTPFARVLV